MACRLQSTGRQRQQICRCNRQRIAMQSKVACLPQLLAIYLFASHSLLIHDAVKATHQTLSPTHLHVHFQVSLDPRSDLRLTVCSTRHADCLSFGHRVCSDRQTVHALHCFDNGDLIDMRTHLIVRASAWRFTLMLRCSQMYAHVCMNKHVCRHASVWLYNSVVGSLLIVVRTTNSANLTNVARERLLVVE